MKQPMNPGGHRSQDQSEPTQASDAGRAVERSAPVRRRPALPRLVLILGGLAAVVVILVVLFALGGESGLQKEQTTFRVRRQDLRISILESGDLKAIKQEEIKSEVEGQTRIISLIPEGTFISAEDVEAGKLLVELDSSEHKERFTQQEVTFQSAKAGWTQAKERFEIQKNQNASNIRSGQLSVKFSGRAVASTVV